MTLLLDTHTLLRWLADEEISPTARQLIADPDELVVVSAASVWEAAIKRALGKLVAPAGLADAIVDCGFEPLHISAAHAERAGALPAHHRDPFDRMLIAQAQAESLRIVTRDPWFDSYEIETIRC